MFTRIVISLSFVLACGAAESPDATGGGSGDGSDSVDPSSGDDTPLTHGTVRLEFRRDQAQAADPSVGTARILVTVSYQECLQDFYDANPSMRPTGPEGELIFGGEDLGGEGWRDRLCSVASSPADVACVVESIDQVLEPVSQLSVAYTVEGTIENKVLRFGPLPTKETAGCLDPIVRVVPGGIKGYDSTGAEIWSATANPPEAVTDQGGALTVEMARIED